jgi:acyl-CoA synthetase (AMP-forming)/AMP-acid ligase II
MTGPTLGNIARRHAEQIGDKTALRFGGESITYRELEQRACQVANGLIASSIAPGDRVAYIGKNSAAYFEYLLGAAKAGAVMVPISWRLAPPEIEHLLFDSRPRWIIIEEEFFAPFMLIDIERYPLLVGGVRDTYKRWRDAQSSEDPERPAPWDEPALQLYTSGTTGLPKGAVLTHRNLFGLRASMGALEPDWYRWSAEDVSLIAMPVAHISGTGWGIWTLLHGATGVITREFDPHAVFDLMAEHRIGKLMLVPTALQIAVSHPRAHEVDFSFLRYIYYGGAPIPPALLRQGIEVFGCGFVQMYGMTETAGTIVALSPEDHDRVGGARSGSVGKPLPGVELKILDSGEIATRSPANMQGYHHLASATAETIDGEGWLRTGDAGFIDAEGYLHLRDRIKDVIISGGENIYPAEVEHAIRDHPEVAEVAVIGMPDEKWGESVMAVVVSRTSNPPGAESVIAWARERIASFKAPKRIEFVSALPRNASGKILRRELRARFRASS